VLWSDPAIGITWPLASPALSEKDTRYRTLDLSRSDLPEFRPS